MATETKPAAGAAFLLTPIGSAEIFTPERMSAEQRLMRQTAQGFMATTVLPRLPETEAQQEGAMRALLREAGALGLLMADVPARFGGAEAGMLVSVILADALAGDGSFGTAWGVHTTVGTLPLVLYGTEEQKARYLPGLATGELISAYALTEPAAGSDAMAIRTRAVLAPDGAAYLLSGQKQWITNAGLADVFIVFAKIDDTQFTAFLVERTSPGLTLGAEEKKMGIKGSSTRTVYFDGVRVPRAQVLGAIGRGHKIAFNALNIGRLKLGAAAGGSARHVLGLVAPYVQQRTTFGRAIGSYGLIQEKLAGMVAETYAVESLVFRTAALVDAALRGAGAPTEGAGDTEGEALAGLEEYALECALAKVLGSEANSRVIDEGVQIFGGYGFMAEYAIEKAYRDVRITRIFEGTNEINRLLAAGTLVKRALSGRLPLLGALPAAAAALAAGRPAGDAAAAEEGTLAGAAALVERLKQVVLAELVPAAQGLLPGLEEQQEFLGRVGDVLGGVYALDSALTRAGQARRDAPGEAERHAQVAQYLTWRTLPGLRRALEEALAMGRRGATGGATRARVRAYLGDYDLDAVGTGRALAQAVIAANGYPLGR